jgi:hypothetical protein
MSLLLCDNKHDWKWQLINLEQVRQFCGAPFTFANNWIFPEADGEGAKQNRREFLPGGCLKNDGSSKDQSVRVMCSTRKHSIVSPARMSS